MKLIAFFAEFVVSNPWRAIAIGIFVVLSVMLKFNASTINRQKTSIQTLESQVAMSKNTINAQSTIISAQSASIDALKAKSLTLEAQAQKAINSNSKAKKQLALKLREIAELKVSNECQPALNVLKEQAKGVSNDF